MRIVVQRVSRAGVFALAGTLDTLPGAGFTIAYSGIDYTGPAQGPLEVFLDDRDVQAQGFEHGLLARADGLEIRCSRRGTPRAIQQQVRDAPVRGADEHGAALAPLADQRDDRVDALAVSQRRPAELHDEHGFGSLGAHSQPPRGRARPRHHATGGPSCTREATSPARGEGGEPRRYTRRFAPHRRSS